VFGLRGDDFVLASSQQKGKWIMQLHKPNIAVRLEVEFLEDRALPSLLTITPVASLPHSDAYSPRTGGEAVQTGSLLTVYLRNKVDQPALDTVKVVDDGKGDMQVSWDGGPVHAFTGISQIVVNSKPTVTEEVTFELSGGLTEPLDVQLNLSGIHNIVTEHMGGNGVAPSGLTVDIATLRHNGITEVTVTP
jgi:hypothetical protein